MFFLIVGIFVTALLAGCNAQIETQIDVHGEEFAKRNTLAENGVFIQIPGPNPIIRTGPKGAWDEVMLEASDAIRDVDTYYFYYHAIGRNDGDQEGGEFPKAPTPAIRARRFPPGHTGMLECGAWFKS